MYRNEQLYLIIKINEYNCIKYIFLIELDEYFGI